MDSTYFLFLDYTGTYNPSVVTILISGFVTLFLLILMAYLFRADKKKLYQLLVENAISGVYIIQDGKVVFSNPRAAEIMGYTTNEIVGMSLTQIISPEDLERVKTNVEKRLKDEVPFVQYEYRGIKKDSSPIYIEVLGTSTVYNGKPAVMGTIIDITERKEVEELKERLAYFDPMTNLPNQYFIEHKMNEWVQGGLDNKNETEFSFFCIRVNRLRHIESTFGYKTADQVVVRVSERIKKVIPETWFLSRQQDNKFVLLAPEADRQTAKSVAEKIIQQLAKPIKLKSFHIQVSVNIGISHYPTSPVVDKIVENAWIAMRKAQDEGVNRSLVFSESVRERLMEDAMIERHLSAALDHDEFAVYYQPKVDLLSGKIMGLEALLRWNHPTLGRVSPGIFIPIAERTGLIVSMSEWVLREVCKQVRSWEDNVGKRVQVSLNLSPLQFDQPELVDMVKSVIYETGCSPSLIEFEITESFTTDINIAEGKLKALKDIGVRISMDDFGTGYSSLSQINHLSLDTIKIDQSFLREYSKDPNTGTIITTILAMARNLKLKVIAEGVETREQLLFLQENGCDEAQGFLFAKPQPPERLMADWEQIEKVI